MSKDKEQNSTERIDRMIRDFEKTGKARTRRVGTRERDMYQEYVNEAFSAGYLDQTEMHERVERIQGAKVADDLLNTVDDLPSYAELKGRELLPKNVEKKTIGIIRFYTEDHMIFGPILSLILGLLVAVIPGVSFASMHVADKFPFSTVMALTIVLGAATAFMSFCRLLWVMMEEA
jgi:DUF1707 SHOCT-like domain